MNASVVSGLAALLEGTVRHDVPLARYTTYRIGGAAAALVLPAVADDVARALRFARESGTPWLVLGLGSNVLVADRGFDGIVVRLGRGLDWERRGTEDGGPLWEVGAGLPTPLLARRTAAAGLAGMHRLVGVPGTVGGGVFMNAGAHGQEYRHVVRRVELVDETGARRTVSSGEIAWRYRGSGLEGTIVVGAAVALVPEDPEVLAREIRQHLRWRKAGTPFDEPCCGSVFRNPAAPPAPPAPAAPSAPASPAAGGAAGAGAAATPPRAPSPTAGQLIDACGLKGFRIGGAEVSRKHANYIVNTGGATAADVLSVIDVVRERVFREFGVELELEVKLIGSE